MRDTRIARRRIAGCDGAARGGAGCLGIVLAAILLAAGPAAAADPCASMVQSDLNECARSAYRTADTALNGMYVQLMKQVGPKTKEALRAAQKAWLPYRDATCTLDTMGLDGGSAYPMEWNGCLKALTEERTKVLKTYLNCKPDDVNCVGQSAE